MSKLEEIKIAFPEGFWWGSASSATQMEGFSMADGKGGNIWDYWYETEPDRFHQGIGPDNTSQFYTRFKEDILLMKETGHNSFRFSVSWSRMFPTGRGGINEKAIDFYNNVINTLIENKIEPFVNLYHFDMPLAMQEEGGWESRSVVDAYVEFASACFTAFGDRVMKWFTHNEPVVPVECGYLYGHHYPALCDFRKAVQVGFHSLLASAKAIKVYHEKAYGGKIGIILNVTPSYPRSQHPADLDAAEKADLLFNRSFLDPSVKGTFPEGLIDMLRKENFLPQYEAHDLEMIRENTVDLLGINYYQPRRVRAKKHVVNPNTPFLPEHYFDYYDMPGKKVNPYRGWEIYEKGVYDILKNIQENYENIECFISENGMGVENEERFKDSDGMIQDDYRIAFYEEHLKWIHKAINEGVNVKGYHVWTFMDNWSWLNGYKNRYGLVSVDLQNNYNRTIKKSGNWFKKLSQNNGF